MHGKLSPRAGGADHLTVRDPLISSSCISPQNEVLVEGSKNRYLFLLVCSLFLDRNCNSFEHVTFNIHF